MFFEFGSNEGVVSGMFLKLENFGKMLDVLDILLIIFLICKLLLGNCGFVKVLGWVVGEWFLEREVWGLVGGVFELL